MITGLLTPSLESNFTYPQEIKKRLTEKDLGNFEFEQFGIEDVPRSFLARHSPDKLAAHINKEMASHAKVAINLMKQYNWDFTMVVLRGTDTVQHFLWQRKDLLLLCYQKVDQFVGELIGLFPDAVFFIVSDHGFEEIKKILYPDNVLYNAGLLKPTKPFIHGSTFIFWFLVSKIENFILRRLPIQIIKRSSFIRKILFFSSSKNTLLDFSKTKAFSTAEGRAIQINQKKRYEKGIVDEAECQKLCDEIRKLFSELRDPDNNEKIIEEVYQWNEIYGKKAIHPPDIILKLKKGFTSAEWLRGLDNFKRIVKSRDFSLPNIFEDDSAGRTGDHAPLGIFFAYGKNIRKGYQVDGMSVEDILPLILATLGISSPKSIDGKLHEDIFNEKPIIKIINWETHSPEKPVLSSVELKKIHELRNKLKSQ
jgi:predicted AlkP superfamily phosphohydrolase/phosphomutase